MERKEYQINWINKKWDEENLHLGGWRTVSHLIYLQEDCVVLKGPSALYEEDS